MSPSWSKSGVTSHSVLGEGVAGGLEDRAAVGDAERRIHAQAQAFEERGEVPGVDEKSVDGGVAAHRLEPDAVQQGRGERVMLERLVEAGEGGGMSERGGRGRIGDRDLRPCRVEHAFASPHHGRTRANLMRL